MPSDGLRLLRKASTSRGNTPGDTMGGASPVGSAGSRRSGWGLSMQAKLSLPSLKSGTRESRESSPPAGDSGPALLKQEGETISVGSKTELMTREIERLQEELDRAKASAAAAQQEEEGRGQADDTVLRKRAKQKLVKDMEDWPKSDREEKTAYDARLKKMREQEIHLERMKHDKQYRIRFRKTEKMKSSVIADGKAGLASQIAKLNARMHERERERAAEDERVKKMMKTIKRTIKGTLLEFDGGSASSDPDDDDEEEEEVQSRASAASDGSGTYFLAAFCTLHLLIFWLSLHSVAGAPLQMQDLARDRDEKRSRQKAVVHGEKTVDGMDVASVGGLAQSVLLLSLPSYMQSGFDSLYYFRIVCVAVSGKTQRCTRQCRPVGRCSQLLRTTLSSLPCTEHCYLRRDPTAPRRTTDDLPPLQHSRRRRPQVLHRAA